jgi:hypothetical protein
VSYEVRCECGKPHPVTAADAGSSLRCGCGRAVEVPPLHRLRTSAGQTALSADMQLRAMLQRGELPGTDECVRCHRPTGNAVRVVIECERAETKSVYSREGQATGCLLGLLFGWIVIRSPDREDRVVGHDVVFAVPLRICEVCESEIRSAGALRETLRRVPVYAALLDKYPDARITSRG